MLFLIIKDIYACIFKSNDTFSVLVEWCSQKNENHLKSSFKNVYLISVFLILRSGQALVHINFSSLLTYSSSPFSLFRLIVLFIVPHQHHFISLAFLLWQIWILFAQISSLFPLNSVECYLLEFHFLNTLLICFIS